MSKSKGNVIDPLSMIDKYGTDAFRFSLTMLAAQGRDILLSEERIEGARNFVNKIWNASKLTLTFIGNQPLSPPLEESSFLPDKWIRSRVQRVIKEVTESIDTYRFNEAANVLYNFVWHEFCDWYLELIKPNLYGKVQIFDTNSTRWVLYRTLLDILKLLHPIMPFVTEEVYLKMAQTESDSIMISPFPKFDETELDNESEGRMDIVMGVVDVLRNIRGETGIAPNVKIDVIIRADGHTPLLQSYEYHVKELGKIEHLAFKDHDVPEKAAVGIYKGIEVFVPIRDIIDVSAELGRIKKELGKIEEDMERIFNKLNNSSFKEKAPYEVIAKNEAHYVELKKKRDKLSVNRKTLEKLLEE